MFNKILSDLKTKMAALESELEALNIQKLTLFRIYPRKIKKIRQQNASQQTASQIF